MPLFNLVYVSSAAQPFSEAELLELLKKSRVKNALVGITGLLLFREGNFMQALEGEQQAVQETHARIALDPRHRGLITILNSGIEERNFTEWSMGFRNLSSPEVRLTPGYAEFLNEDWYGDKIRETPQRALMLLKTFRKGMTR